MPEDTKIQPAEEPAATDSAETGATEASAPEKISLDDAGDFTKEELKDLVVNKTKWEQSLNEKGRVLNDRLRELDLNKHETASLKAELANIQKQLAEANQRSQDIDWEHEDDPDKRTQMFFKDVSNKMNKVINKVDQLEQKQQKNEQATKEQEIMNYWNGVYARAVTEHQISGDVKANNFIKSYVKGKMVEVGGQNWDENKILGWAKEANEYIQSVGKKAVGDWTKKKVEKKGQKVPTAGETPAPKAGKKITGDMSVQEQLDVMAQDPNLQ